jgi:23S rRNA (cytidine1920-2'-O)/16S rRNA (cytidine1409-2'-O)-methyltransferase
MKKKRLDLLLVECDLVESRSLAQRLIYAGEVTVNGQIVDKPGTSIPVDAELEIKAQPRFVSRGGEKLDAMLRANPGYSIEHQVAADIGASTGGFTDCLLQHGASKVYAIDVGYGQLAWKLRQDPRVVVIERTNARFLDTLPEKVDLIVSDVSFISLRLIYANAINWLHSGGFVISLIKPQFEAGREAVGKGGVVRDPAVHRQVLEKVIADMHDLGLVLLDLMVSPIKGAAGNIEFLGMWMDRTADWEADLDIPAEVLNPEGRKRYLIETALDKSLQLFGGK